MLAAKLSRDFLGGQQNNIKADLNKAGFNNTD
jgi:hypothetical protein